MNISYFADRVRAFVLGAGLALMTGLAASHAYAADTPKIDAAKQTKAMADAPAIIGTAKIACDPSNAYPWGSTDYKKPDGSKVKTTIYEFACKTGPGFMVSVASPTEIYQPFTCSMAAKVQKTNATSILCNLPENKPHYAWLNAVVQPYLPGCVVNNARILGSTTSGALIDRYEVGCLGQVGGLIDYPQLGSTAPIVFRNCLIAAGSTGTTPCEFSTKDQISASLKPLADKSDPKCQVNNVRFVGINKEGDGYFYEFGCANQAGFIVLSKLDSSTFVRTVPCSSAAGLGGCSFTDKAQANAGANSGYSDVLKKAGITCTISDYNLVGQQESTKRDYIEFKCPEQPWGLIGFVPQPGSSAGVSVTDCYIDQVRRKSCTLTTPDVLKAQLDKLIKAAQPTKGCDVSEVRYIGESTGEDKGVIAELACVNKRGYIVVANAQRTNLVLTTPCRIAKAHNDPQQCTIAGNGTYTASDD